MPNVSGSCGYLFISRAGNAEVLLQGHVGSLSRSFCNKIDTNGPDRYRKVTHCVFDLDGTIVDSEKTYHRILRQICEKLGAKYSLQFEKEMYGGTDHEICTTVAERLKLPISADELKGKLRVLSKKYMPISPLQKGAKKLLYHLHGNKIPFALVTNASKEDVCLHEKVRPELFSLFHHKVCSNDPEISRPKPCPEPYLVAAKRFIEKPKPEDCLAFEDSVVGVRAAVDANMQVVMIPCSNIARKETGNATLVLQSLLEFKPEVFGLPPFTEHTGNR